MTSRFASSASAWAVAATLLAGITAAHAELAVSANDGKQVRDNDVVNGPQPDSISVLDITPQGVKKLGQLAAPACMIGSPTAVAVAKDSSFALVTACEKTQGKELVANDTGAVVDLSDPAHPRVIQTFHTGERPGGVSISPDGSMALVANADSDSISVFTITGKTMHPAGRVHLPQGSGPHDVVFTPDGKTAIAVGRYNSRLMILTVNGRIVKYTGRMIATGINPYGAVVTHDGKYVINTNLGGVLPPPGEKPKPHAHSVVTISDIATGKVAQTVDVGPTSEHIFMSADGSRIGVVVANGAASVRSDPSWDKVTGILEVYRVGDGTLTPAGRTSIGHWCQGGTFSRDGKTVLVQCAAEREIEVFHYDGTSLTQDKAATLAMPARPGSIATAYSR